MRRYGWWLFWGLAALLLFFGNGQLWITNSVESNYALTAKEMILSGDWISPPKNFTAKKLRSGAALF